MNQFERGINGDEHPLQELRENAILGFKHKN